MSPCRGVVLDVPGGVLTGALAINELGQVVGCARTPGGQRRDHPPLSRRGPVLRQPHQQGGEATSASVPAEAES